METIIFGNYTVQDILIAAGVVIGLLFLWRAFKKILGEKISGKKEVGPHAQLVICFGCGWEGPVSRYDGKCPRCNKPIGEQKAKKYN